ncbi:MAG: 4'-phosphopantetheinyl transferase superfamily protein [Bacteroidales bacterium]|nr:4'-phosphopantetheinyl transferase superfamily protein [Bacteroidales bacterium]
MAIVLKSFAKDNALSAVWKIEEDEQTLNKLCSLTQYDKNLLSNISSMGRRLEILAARATLYTLNPDITITYKGRKPICNYGYVSISHSDTMLAVIWHPSKQVSVDIEAYDPRIIRIAKRAFNINELEFANNNIEMLTKIWSCKECVYKAVNKSAVEFQQQISVFDFHEQDNIKCEFNYKSIVKTFFFKHISLYNHALVWGVFSL